MTNENARGISDDIDDNLDRLYHTMKRMARVDCYLDLIKYLEQVALAEDKKDICRYCEFLKEFHQSFEEEKSVYTNTICRLDELSQKKELSVHTLEELVSVAQLQDRVHTLKKEETTRQRAVIQQLVDIGYSQHFAKAAAIEQELVVLVKVEALCLKYNLSI
jgi:hypothetical protein